MTIPFHDLESQYVAYRDEINEAIQSVLNSCQFIMGPDVAEFERELSVYLGAKHVITCASGTDALLLALMSLSIGPGDEVITTPFTFIATAEVIALLGAKPVFVDIQSDTYHLDPQQLSEAITSNTRAIIPVSLYGQVADMQEINDIALKAGEIFGNKITVIEDAAQSLGASYGQRKSGNLSDMACLSFFPSKPLGCYGDGGAVVVQDDSLVQKLKSLRIHGQEKRYQHQYVGINGRLDTLQAAILRVKLRHFEKELQQRRAVAHRYQEHLADKNLILPIVKSGRQSVYAQYSIRVKDRDHFIECLKQQDIPTAVHYPKPLHLQTCFEYLNYKPGDFPIAEQIAAEIVSLPMSAFITAEQQESVIAAIDATLVSELVPYSC